MSQRQSRGGSGSGEDDSCGEAVMAAVKAISDHCDTDGVPMEMSNGMVAMVPQEDMERVANAAPGRMSDEEVLDFAEQSPWLSEWAGSLCSQAGLREGSSQYEQCLINYGREVLGSQG